jgi:hypothetical protein
MTIEIIDIGSTANDGSGDPLRVAFNKINNNFAQIANGIIGGGSPAGPNGAIQFNDMITGTGANVSIGILSGKLNANAITIVNGGTGYDPNNPPEITISRGNTDNTGTGASAIATINSLGVLTGITIIDVGANYSVQPIVTIQSTETRKFGGTTNLSYDSANGNVTISANLIPVPSNTFGLGANTNTFGNIWAGPNAIHIGNANSSTTLSYANNTITLHDTIDPTKLTNLVAGNLTVSDFKANTLSVGNTTTFDTISTTTSSNVESQVIYTVLDCAFQTGEFDIYSYEANTNNMQSVKVVGSKTDNDANVRYVAYSTLFSGDILVNSYDMSIANCNVKLMISPNTSNVVTHKISYKVTK